MKRDRDKQFQSGYAGIFVVLMLSVLFLLVSGAQLFVPGFRLVVLGWILSAVLLIWGVWMVLSYFRRQLYRRVSNYDFSVGVLLALAGVLVFLRAEEVTGHMPLFLGILCLLQGVVLLQNALQIRILKGKIWGITLLGSLLTIAASVLIILDPVQWLTSHPTVLYAVLLAVGVLGIVTMLIVAWFTRRLRKDESRKTERNLEELEELDRKPEETVVVSPSDVEDADASDI